MPKRISLSCYSVRFREPNKHSFISIDDERLKDLPEFFSRYFLGLKKTAVNDADTQKMLGIESFSDAPEGQHGLIRSGDYGYEADLVDTNGKIPSYRRVKEQAQILPFYFRLFLPKTGDVGILILQRFGVYGVRRVLESDLNPKFESAFENVKLNIWPQVPDGVLQHLLKKGNLKAITLRKHTLPSDIADALNGGDIDTGKVDVVITATHANRFQALLKTIRLNINQHKTGKLNEVVEMEGFRHDKILLSVEVGGREQTVDLSNLNKLRATIDVTKKIKIANDGHPTFASIAKEAGEVLASVKKEMGI